MSDPEKSALRPSIVTTATLRAHLLLTQGQAKEAVEILQIARGWGEAHPNFDFFLATRFSDVFIEA